MRGSVVPAELTACGICVIELPDVEIIIVGAERFRCAEVLFLAETNELLDGEIITVRWLDVWLSQDFRMTEAFDAQLWCVWELTS